MAFDATAQPQERGDVVAFDVLHGDEVARVQAAQVVDLHDVWMVELTCELRFIQKRAYKFRLAGELRQDALDHQVALKAVGGAVPREIDLRHAAGGQLLDDLVARRLHLGPILAQSGRNPANQRVDVTLRATQLRPTPPRIWA